MITLKVDFNTRGRGGRVRVSQQRLPRPLAIGERVIVEDPAEGMSFVATVVEVDEITGRAYLDVEWEPAGRPESRIAGNTGTAFAISIRDWVSGFTAAPSVTSGEGLLSFHLAQPAPRTIDGRPAPSPTGNAHVEPASA
jgi:hypothetical protein